MKEKYLKAVVALLAIIATLLAYVVLPPLIRKTVYLVSCVSEHEEYSRPELVVTNALAFYNEIDRLEFEWGLEKEKDES